MQEYLAFVDEIGTTSDGDYIYRLDYTTNTDVVWGDFFNIAPAIIVPDLQPDVNCLSSRCRVKLNSKLETAKKNSCFSMQDCIDGIIALAFSEINDETIEIDGEPLFLMFAEEKESVCEKLIKCGGVISNDELVTLGDDSAIDELINSDTTGENNDDDYDF